MGQPTWGHRQVARTPPCHLWAAKQFALCMANLGLTLRACNRSRLATPFSHQLHQHWKFAHQIGQARPADAGNGSLSPTPFAQESSTCHDRIHWVQHHVFGGRENNCALAYSQVGAGGRWGAVTGTQSWQDPVEPILGFSLAASGS